MHTIQVIDYQLSANQPKDFLLCLELWITTGVVICHAYGIGRRPQILHSYNTDYLGTSLGNGHYPDVLRWASGSLGNQLFHLSLLYYNPWRIYQWVCKYFNQKMAKECNEILQADYIWYITHNLLEQVDLQQCNCYFLHRGYLIENRCDVKKSSQRMAKNLEWVQWEQMR